MSRTENLKKEHNTISQRVTFNVKQDRLRFERRIADDKDSIHSFIKKSMNVQNVPIPSLQNENSLVHDDQSKSELFNKYFSSVLTDDNNILPTFEYRTNVKCGNLQVCGDDVRGVLKQMKSKFSSGPDGFPTVLFKSLADELAEPLSSIFNTSIFSKKCATIWKTADVVPIYKKKGSRSKVSSYRPISLTCVVCRVLEKLIRDVVYNHLVSNVLLSECTTWFC